MSMYYLDRERRARERARERRYMTPEERKINNNAGLIAVIFWVAVGLFICWLTSI